MLCVVYGCFYILVLEVPYYIIVSLFVCMIYVVWLVLDGSLCRGGGGGALLLSGYPQFIMSVFDVA